MLGRNKEAAQSLLCLDLGTSSIRAGVFQEENGVFQLKGVGKVDLPYGLFQSGLMIHLAQVISCVQEAVKKAENMARLAPKELVIGLSTDLVQALSVHLQFLRTKPDRPIDDQELKSMLYELEWEAFDMAKRSLSDEMCLPEMDLRMLNASVLNLLMDGQRIDDPRGRTGKILEAELFHCFSSVQYFGQIQSIAVELPFHQLKGVFMLSFSLCHGFLQKNPEESALIIDIGSGTTDLGLIIDGKIIGTKSFAMGGSSFTKRISHELGTSFDEAESIKMNYGLGELEKKSHRVIQDALALDLDLWISSIIFSLKELAFKKLPNTIFLCGKGSLLPEFESALSSFHWEHQFPFQGSLEVKQLEYADIFSHELDTERFEKEYLPLMAVALSAKDLLYGNSVIEGILNTIIADKRI